MAGTAGALATSQNNHFLLELDTNSRSLVGVSMPPLLTGELKLLQYLGSKPGVWHSCRLLSLRVFERDDPSARQLVWKYVSTLRHKLASSQCQCLETCRRRGYRCAVRIQTVGDAVEPLPEQR